MRLTSSISNGCPYIEDSILVVIVQVGDNSHIRHICLGHSKQSNLACDASQLMGSILCQTTQHVSQRLTSYGKSQFVVASLEMTGNINFVRCHASHMIAYFYTIQIYMILAMHTIKT